MSLSNLIHTDEQPHKLRVRDDRSDLKALISQQIHHAIRKQKVYWDARRVEDMPLDLDDFKGKIRFVPTFAYRQILYDAPEQSATESCRICSLLASDASALVLPDDSLDAMYGWSVGAAFRDLLVIQHNNFPYFDMQVLVSAKQHISSFATEHYQAILDFILYSGFQSAALQIRGSGATIPDHAHISVSDEAMPIFDLPKRPCATRDGVALLRVPAYAGALYVLQSVHRHRVAHWITMLTRWIEARHLSFNLFIDREACVYIIPRKQEFAQAINRKMGSVEVAGIFLGNGLGTTSNDVQEIEHIIRQRCQAMTPALFSQALRETVCSQAEGSFIEAMFLDE